MRYTGVSESERRLRRQALVRAWVAWHTGDPRSKAAVEKGQSEALSAGYSQDDLDRIMSEARGIYWHFTDAMRARLRKAVEHNDGAEVDKLIKEGRAAKKRG